MTRASRGGVAATMSLGLLVAATVSTSVAVEAAPRHPNRVYRFFDSPAPCAVACPYWTDEVTAVLGIQNHACLRHPVAPGTSWDDERLVVPLLSGHQTTAFLVVGLEPLVDRDLFVCRVHNAGQPDEWWEPETIGANIIGVRCRTMETPVALGCPEEVVVPVTAGGTYVIRVFNWLDVSPALGWYELFPLR